MTNREASPGFRELAIRVFDGHLCATDRLLYGAMPYPELIAFADSLASEAERLGATESCSCSRPGSPDNDSRERSASVPA